MIENEPKQKLTDQDLLGLMGVEVYAFLAESHSPIMLLMMYKQKLIDCKKGLEDGSKYVPGGYSKNELLDYIEDALIRIDNAELQLSKGTT